MKLLDLERQACLQVEDEVPVEFGGVTYRVHGIDVDDYVHYFVRVFEPLKDQYLTPMAKAAAETEAGRKPDLNRLADDVRKDTDQLEAEARAGMAAQLEVSVAMKVRWAAMGIVEFEEKDQLAKVEAWVRRQPQELRDALAAQAQFATNRAHPRGFSKAVTAHLLGISLTALEEAEAQMERLLTEASSGPEGNTTPTADPSSKEPTPPGNSNRSSRRASRAKSRKTTPSST